ncbi:MAG: cytidylate kinase-like family protein [Streptosporangiales bacterium]|nr:cytidylate kinase-like family protein [Streptosporangiales bacterium]
MDQVVGRSAAWVQTDRRGGGLVYVVTVSATYGTGGSVVGPAVAERLGVPFVDRAIPATVATEIGVPLEEALAHDDRAAHGLGRLLASAARLPSVTFGGVDPVLPDQALIPEEEFVAQTESVIRQIVRGQGGVILGRAGAMVLADHPSALHVRLDGRRDRRIAQAARLRGIDEQTARALLDESDRARAAYVKHFYRVDPADPTLYHLVVNTSVLPLESSVDLIVAAARVRAAEPSSPPEVAR